jgi:hypothetical protein
MEHRHFRNVLFLAAAIAACAGCPGTLDDPARFLVDVSDAGIGGDAATACPDVPNALFVPTCAAAPCHSEANKAQSLDLQSPDVANRLVGVPATEGDGLLIDPTHPSQSVVYTKLTSTPPFGARMPLGITPLDDATLACVLSWVSRQTGSAGSDAGSDAASDAGSVDATDSSE